EPGASLGAAPSGLADWPRPFVLRVAHLDGLTIPAGNTFFLDAHSFDLHQPSLDHFRAALAGLAEKGLGPGRGRAQLVSTDQLELDDSVRPSAAPSVMDLDPWKETVTSVKVKFHTPTELKSGGDVAGKPEFPILFGRLRDRISTLRALYGRWPL